MKKIALILMVALIIGCQKKKEPVEVLQVSGHPLWIMQGNVYEVNVRQYTSEGTFRAFAKNLDRLKEMGVQTLWFMPLNPISKKDRKGTLGSYYAVSSYTSVNPEFGTLNDWKNLVTAAHEKGMKVIIDWVPNHTGADHPWLTSHPEFYAKDKDGNPAVMMDWTDTRQLDYHNAVMEDSMIACMKYWMTNTSIDGFRVDVAWNVPASFWNKCIPQLKQLNNDIFMLAEGDKPYLHESGFDATYPWEMFHMMEKIAKGVRPAYALDSVKQKFDTVYTKNAIALYFTSNHDENSWNKADYGTFPGPVHAPFAVFTQTMVRSVPLIYSGQEEPVLKGLLFFEKDPITFGRFERAVFYKTLLALRKRNPALSADASFTKVDAGDRNAVYSFVREKEGKKILVVLNLSDKKQTVTVTDKNLLGKAHNVFSDKDELVSDQPTSLSAWGYLVYEY
ncbi:MAG TPA: alpha-amylase family glycosyl hydrolase [Cyclobacteriaceae bacterium]|jgi:glycosidase|nr:alpha-amylase family glycosyl hydrolase [Cyclobacteriaceae bacterium]